MIGGKLETRNPKQGPLAATIQLNLNAKAQRREDARRKNQKNMRQWILSCPLSGVN